MFTPTLLDTFVVMMVKETDVAPAGTVTDVGTVAEIPEDDRFTTVPPTGAGDNNVTVPVAEFPPTTAPGVILRLYKVG